jgi:Protein of unknown function (DUF4446)
VHDLTSTVGVVALAAAGVAVIALAWAVALTIRMRRMRADQRVVLGEREGGDLVAHAAQLDRSFRMLHDYVEEVAARLDGRLAEAERRLDGSIAYRGLVRYDAYNEMSGRQSTTIALLDASGSGIVLSSIHHREQARLYAKRVVERRGELELSPEEEEAIRIALAGATPSPASPA